MNKECSVVCDLLPLYLEGMTSDDTADFVREHLTHCTACAGQWERMKAGTAADRLGEEAQSLLEAEVLNSMRALRRRFRSRLLRVSAVIAAVLIALGVLLHFFPVYRIAEIGPMALGNYYTRREIARALSIGSAADRREAQAVLRLADKAFNDTRHTRAENEQEYGLLKRYATATDAYGDTAFNEHSLELWSAHLGKDEGWIWVYYSSETFNHDGSTACGSWRIPSLWKVEKSETGEWVVVQIREHP